MWDWSQKMSLGGFEYQSGSELQAFLKIQRLEEISTESIQPPVSPVGLCFQLGTLECGSLLLQLPHKKHQKKNLRNLTESSAPGNLGIQIYYIQCHVICHSFMNNVPAIVFSALVNMFEGSANCFCLARKRCRSRSFREAGQHGVWMAVRLACMSWTRNPPGALGIPQK